MYWDIRDPTPEKIQNEAYSYRRGLFVDPNFWEGWAGGLRRGAPAELPFREYDPVRGGWWQGDRKLKNFKPNLYMTRPHDGKRSGAFGRLKDALTREGADVFVTASGDKRTLMRDRPQRWQWSGWQLTPHERWERWAYDKDWRPQDVMDVLDTPWTSSRREKPYNFRTREYERPKASWYFQPDKVWIDARWSPGARRDDSYPLSKRNINGKWQTRVPWFAGDWPGGRPRPPG